MSRRGKPARALGCAALLLALGARSLAAGAPASVRERLVHRAPSQATTPPPSEAAAESRAELRRLVAAGLAHEAVTRFAAAVEPGGPWRDDGAAVAWIGRAWFEVGEEERALVLLGGYDGPPETRRPVELELARAHMLRDELAAARRLVGEPRTAAGWSLLTRIAARAGDLAGAESAAARLLELSPHDPGAPAAWHALAQAALQRRDGDRARECLAAAAASRRWQELRRARLVQVLRSPEDPLPLLGLGLLWAEAGELERARARFAELTERFPRLLPRLAAPGGHGPRAPGPAFRRRRLRPRRGVRSRGARPSPGPRTPGPGRRPFGRGARTLRALPRPRGNGTARSLGESGNHPPRCTSCPPGGWGFGMGERARPRRRRGARRARINRSTATPPRAARAARGSPRSRAPPARSPGRRRASPVPAPVRRPCGTRARG